MRKTYRDWDALDWGIFLMFGGVGIGMALLFIVAAIRYAITGEIK